MAVDKNVNNVAAQLLMRAERGMIKYGCTTERKDLTTFDWIQHALEEAMDFCVYLERLKQEFKNK